MWIERALTRAGLRQGGKINVIRLTLVVGLVFTCQLVYLSVWIHSGHVHEDAMRAAAAAAAAAANNTANNSSSAFRLADVYTDLDVVYLSEQHIKFKFELLVVDNVELLKNMTATNNNYFNSAKSVSVNIKVSKNKKAATVNLTNFRAKMNLTSAANLTTNLTDVTNVNMTSVNGNSTQLTGEGNQTVSLLVQTSNQTNTNTTTASTTTKAAVPAPVKLKRGEFTRLLNYLYDSGGFLLDAPLLRNLSQPPFTFASWRNQYGKSGQRLVITFGIFANAFEMLMQNAPKKLTNKCEMIAPVYGAYYDTQYVSGARIECKLLTVYISVVYERGTFLWIGNDAPTNETSRWSLFKQKPPSANRSFGDVPRSLKKFVLSFFMEEESVGTRLNVPADIATFLYDYDHSPFIECNRSLARRVLVGNYKQNVQKNTNLSAPIFEIHDIFMQNKKHFWLAGGTLLGWYRECGIIPHTEDVDMGTLASEYDPRVRSHFLGNHIVSIRKELGMVNDSLEIRLFTGKNTFDLFYAYDHNETMRWCSYQWTRMKFKRLLPKFDEFCSAEFLNHQTMVPCDPVGYLDLEYGAKKWQIPDDKFGTKWTNVIENDQWPESVYPYVLRYYGFDGRLKKQLTLKKINEELTVKLSALPDDIEPT